MSLNTTPGEYSYTFKYSFKCSWILRRPSSEICIFWEPVSWKYIAFTDLHVLVLLLVAAWIFAGNLPFCFMKWVVSLDMYLSMKYSWKMHIWTTLLSLWSITLYSNYTTNKSINCKRCPHTTTIFMQSFKLVRTTTMTCLWTQSLKGSENIGRTRKTFSPQWGSNSRPLVYKTSALTTELWRHICCIKDLMLSYTWTHVNIPMLAALLLY